MSVKPQWDEHGLTVSMTKNEYHDLISEIVELREALEQIKNRTMGTGIFKSSDIFGLAREALSKQELVL